MGHSTWSRRAALGLAAGPPLPPIGRPDNGTTQMTMTRKEVLAVARLARLELDDATADALTQDLDKILGYVEKLNELDTEGIEPTLQVSVEAAKLRPDVRAQGLTKEDALREAPRADEVGFLVPGFVDES